MPTLYDPAVQGIDVKPEGQFDGVMCTDVLEHIPEDELDTVIADLAGYAKQWAFIAVCCRPAKKTFPRWNECPCDGAAAELVAGKAGRAF